MMYRNDSDRRQQAGFTIVELMIATLVFSMVLLVITVGVMSFTRAYYRGVNQSNTQRVARAVLENVSQAIQFSGDQVTAPIASTQVNGRTYEGLCVGGQRYSYLRGWQQIDSGADGDQNQADHVLVIDKPGICGGLAAQDLGGPLASGSTDLLSPMMRISKLDVAPLSGANDTFQVTVRVVYGDNDLLDDPTGPNASCKVSISGSEYCGQSELTTTVKKRISH